jgi:aryl-alcohol dehydrogenase-like predicted oxidoreductase
MEKRIFGRTGLSVSALGFGGAPIGYLNTDRQQVIRLLNLLLDLGVNVIDTAASYPGSEEVIGEAIGTRRDQFVLVSKCGSKFPDLSGEAWSDELITATIDRSLTRLRTDQLDVMLLHSCGIDVLKKGEAIAALVKAKQAGKIRHAGYSGDNEAAQYAAAHPDLDVLQTSVNITDQWNIDHVLPIAREHRLGVMAKRPIADACWKEHRPGLYQHYAKTYEDRLKQMNLSAEDFGLPWPELALRFSLSFPEVSTAIVGTTNPDHAKSNVEIAARARQSNPFCVPSCRSHRRLARPNVNSRLRFSHPEHRV